MKPLQISAESFIIAGGGSSWAASYLPGVSCAGASFRSGLQCLYLLYSSPLPSLSGWPELYPWVNSCTQRLMWLFRHGDSSLCPFLMQISVGFLRSRISAGHVGQEALFPVPLHRSTGVWLSLIVYLLNPSVLCWFECLHCPDMLPEAGRLWLCARCFRSPGI